MTQQQPEPNISPGTAQEQQRKQRNRERALRRRQRETSEERQRRQQTERQRAALRRQTESPAEREQRKRSGRMRAKRRRENETAEEKMRRREANRLRMAERRRAERERTADAMPSTAAAPMPLGIVAAQGVTPPEVFAASASSEGRFTAALTSCPLPDMHTGLLSMPPVHSLPLVAMPAVAASAETVGRGVPARFHHFDHSAQDLPPHMAVSLQHTHQPLQLPQPLPQPLSHPHPSQPQHQQQQPHYPQHPSNANHFHFYYPQQR
ncbi:hypothetical protein GGI15_004520 [Coemansia interrupta]|uniref:Uncharacterized protein n=1 Tax=Coemansia interrupta TaxID=1126814 RepID=A0A9W8LFZ2_9FUNG|nr:hypothetical protein GGI15_004520 [Coemansia interrupta]